MSFLPLAPRNRCGAYPTSPVDPRDDRHFLSDETKRWFYPFNRATAEAGIDTRQRLETRRTLWFSGTTASKSDKVRLDKGFQNHGFWRPFGHFSGEGKVTRGLGPGRARFVPARPAAGESQPLGQMRWRSRCETGSPARRRAHQPFGAGQAPLASYASVSKRMVTGPSFSEVTSISAPNSPCWTLKPRSRHLAINPS